MKYVPIYIACTLCVVFVFTAHAQTSTPEFNSGERAAEFREQVNERREAVTTAIEERRAALSERLQERLTNLAANMSNRFDQVISRLENIHKRIDSRADKIEAEGKDVTEAKAALERAQNELTKAKNLMSAIDAEVATVIGSPEPKVEWQNLKRTYSDAKEAIKVAHNELRNALVALKNTQITQAEESVTEDSE